MADYGADPLWDREGVMADLTELPVSPALILRLRDWAGWYERNDEWGGVADRIAFSAAGHLIARAIKAELPDWTVIYWDEAAYFDSPDGPRDAFEYEIDGSGRRTSDETLHLLSSPANARRLMDAISGFGGIATQ